MIWLTPFHTIQERIRVKTPIAVQEKAQEIPSRNSKISIVFMVEALYTTLRTTGGASYVAAS